MDKVLFAHDVPIVKSLKDGKYYSGSFDYTLWKRYLSFGEKLVVACRISEVANLQEDKYQLSSGENVNFISIPNLSNPKTRLKNLKKAKFLLTEQLSKVDGVVVRLPSEIGYLTYNLAKKKNVPVAVEMVGCPEDSYKYHGSIIGKIYAPIAKMKYKKALKQSLFTLYVTQSYLQKKYPSKGYTRFASNVNITRNSHYTTTKKRENNTESLKIGTIGSLDVKYKGLETAIRSVSLIKRLNPNLNVELEVVGDGDKQKWASLVEKLDVKKSILFLGKLNSSKVPEWLSTLDIYIQPSKTEGLPRAVIEAMNEGVPVVASNVGGLPEIVDSDYLHHHSDYKTLANKILELSHDDEKRKEQSKLNLNKSKKYTSDVLVEKRMEFYNEFSSYVKNSKGR